jgi:hypothetical protein
MRIPLGYLVPVGYLLDDHFITGTVMRNAIPRYPYVHEVQPKMITAAKRWNLAFLCVTTPPSSNET